MASEWFEDQFSATMHKPVRYKFKRNRILVKAPNEQFQADLCDMQKLKKFNSGMSYVLTCIDCFTRYAWAIAIKSKEGKEVANALRKILDDKTCKRLQTDKGSEFRNSKVQKVLSDYNVEYWTTQNDDIKAAIVERFNRTLKTRMYKYFTEKETRRYVDILPKLVRAYNITTHRSIGMRPVDAYARKFDALQNLYKSSTRQKPFKYKVGDTVRISKTRRAFRKGYAAGWSEEIFTIVKRQRRDRLPVYELRDANDEPIKGAKFYESELQRVTRPQRFRVEKVLKRRGDKYLVKWRGYSDDFNSWVSDIQDVNEKNLSSE